MVTRTESGRFDSEYSIENVLHALKQADVLDRTVAKDEVEVIVKLKQNPQLELKALVRLIVAIAKESPDEISQEGEKGDHIRFWWD